MTKKAPGTVISQIFEVTIPAGTTQATPEDLDLELHVVYSLRV